MTYGRSASGRVPPGWPAAVPPPGEPRFVERAVGWLLDACPPDYRGHAVLLAHPVVLAWLATRHVDAQLDGLSRALSTARGELAEAGVATGTVEATLEVLHAEGARLRATRRGCTLLADALRGGRWVPRL
ncbi:hypothetical protein [Aquipuribacter nitratireducens]|uniref:Uncharacterized protein n=1 Tax=Aquipuribacter nitratireducens TaxID=650104 RepID=A0ABW0GRY1_9MICO